MPLNYFRLVIGQTSAVILPRVYSPSLDTLFSDSPGALLDAPVLSFRLCSDAVVQTLCRALGN